MITPRQTRLVRVSDLHSLQYAILSSSCAGDNLDITSSAVVVPSRAAASELVITLQDLARANGNQPLLALPEILTRDDWHERLAEGLDDKRLNEFERDAIFTASARRAFEEFPAPFVMRSGLVPEIIALYDGLRRQLVSVSSFERNLLLALEPGADTDRGANRMLRQTRFLVATFRAYERTLAEIGLLDEHLVRERILERDYRSPFRRVVVAVADQAAEAGGLWRADFDLLTRMAGVEQIDLIATESLLATGFHERLHDLLPEIEEHRVVGPPRQVAVLTVPDRDRRHFVFRDREDELRAAVRSIRSAHGRLDLNRTAIVFRKPLPYIYLAGQVMRSSSTPYEALDALPLAAEPFSAAFDLVVNFVLSGFTRGACVALLQSPHFVFRIDGQDLTRSQVAALNRAMHRARYLGGRDRLRQLVETWEDASEKFRNTGVLLAGRAMLQAADELRSLEETGRPHELINVLRRFLEGHEATPPADDGTRERQLRARAAVMDLLGALESASQRHDEAPVSLADLAATIRRWIEGRTFTPRTGGGGVRLLDADAARFGRFDEVRLVGLVEGEWPERPRRSVFYPVRLLMPLGWPGRAERLSGARAAFQDLLSLARLTTAVSTFTLEDESIVAPSPFIEELSDGRFETVPAGEVERDHPGRGSAFLFGDEALSEAAIPTVDGGTIASDWLALRQRRTPADAPQFHGNIGLWPPQAYSVSSVERFLDCPFKYFSAYVLRLVEDPEDEPALTPLARGRFVHEVFHDFYDEWGRRGQSVIDLDNLDEARELFTNLAERHIQRLPDADRPLERAILLGSAVAAGLGERVFQIEIERGEGVIERLLEYKLEGVFEFAKGEPGLGVSETREIAIRGIADRIDLLNDGTLRIVDYKIGRAPDSKRAIQLAVYGKAAAQSIPTSSRNSWRIGEAGYIAFGERQAFTSIAPRGRELADAIEAGTARFIAAVEQIEKGEFPPRPAESFLCEYCAFTAVCRKDLA